MNHISIISLYFCSWIETHAHTRPHTTHSLACRSFKFLYYYYFLSVSTVGHATTDTNIQPTTFIRRPCTKWISPAVASTRRVANRNMFIVHSVEQKEKRKKNDFIFLWYCLCIFFRILLVHFGIYRLPHIHIIEYVDFLNIHRYNSASISKDRAIFSLFLFFRFDFFPSIWAMTDISYACSEYVWVCVRVAYDMRVFVSVCRKCQKWMFEYVCVRKLVNSN